MLKEASSIFSGKWVFVKAFPKVLLLGVLLIPAKLPNTFIYSDC